MNRSARLAKKIRNVVREPRRLPLWLQAGLQVLAYRRLVVSARLPKLLQRGVPVIVSDRRDADLLRDYVNWWMRRQVRPCMPRALATFHALRRIGERPQFVISIRQAAVTAGEPVLAHAWIELDGAPYREDEAVGTEEWKEIFRHRCG